MIRRRLRPKITQKKSIPYPDLKKVLFAGGGFTVLAILIFILGVFWGRQEEPISSKVEEAQPREVKTEKTAKSPSVELPTNLPPEFSFFDNLPDKASKQKKPIEQERDRIGEKKQVEEQQEIITQSFSTTLERKPRDFSEQERDGIGEKRRVEEQQVKEQQKITAQSVSTTPERKPRNSSDNFVIQVISSPKKSEVLAIVQKLKEQDILAYIQTENFEGKDTYYRVRIGAFKTQKEAEKTAKQLKESGIIKTTPWITKVK